MKSTPGDGSRQKDAEAVVTTIRANCPACGDIQLTATELTVRVCSDDDRGSYWFSCPECERPVTKDASPRIIELLVSSGVRKQVWRLPAEVREPHYSGSALTPDDLLDFHLLLERDGWMAELEESVRGPIDR
jgi:endogenous inhibitor of DNA gyrase (YacG/DUF329 family)